MSEPSQQLPSELLALSRVPISGTYDGVMRLPDAGKFQVELRVDVDQAHANSPVLNRVSWDLFQVFSSAGVSWRVYRGSWIVNSPTATWEESKVTIVGTAQHWDAQETISASVTIGWSTNSIGPVTLSLADGAEQSEFVCQWKSNLFRKIDLQIDVCKSVNKAPLLPSYDTHGHNDRPADIAQRTLTIEEAFAESGIGVTVGSSHTVLDDSDPSFTSWTPAELHDAMEDYYEDLSATPQWRLWGVMAGLFEDSGVGGIMFDAASQFGGAGKAPERQGFALFRNHSWFDNLASGAPTTQAQAWAARHFLYTWVHEAGHAFNHLHSWDKARPDSLSWMNYDWRYDSRNGTGEFWKRFQFRFDEEELIHLRHGSRNAVIMGGDSWASGGHMETEHSRLSEIEIVDGTPPIEVLLRSKELFQLMEPVSLEIRLRNLTRKTVKADAKLQPEFGVAAVVIRKPDGNLVQYEPLMCKLAERSIIALGAPTKSQTGSDRHSETIDLTFGKGGFYFDRPGSYAIRVIYQGLDGTLIPSNLHRIRVASPFSPESESLAQDFFTRDVGLAIYLNGSRSPRFKNAMETLRELVDRFPKQTIGAKAASVVAAAIGRPYFKVKNNKIQCQSKADPEEALSITDSALATYSSLTEKAANLPHRNLVEQRIEYWNAIEDQKNAKAEVTTLSSQLKNRGVNSSVIKDLKSLL